MRSKFFVIMAIIALVVIGGVFDYDKAWGQGDDPKMQIVVIDDDPPTFNRHEVVFSLPYDACDKLRFDNIAGFSVALLNDTTPTGLDSKTPTPGGDIIPNNMSGTYEFCCPTDEGTWRFVVGKQGARDYSDTLRVIVTCHQTPSLTQWGLIILVGLIVASTVFIMLRRRKAAVPV